MIKIIKEGKLPKVYKRIYTATCDKCKCEFEFEDEDFTRVEKRFDGNYFINCPFCGYEIAGGYNYFKPQLIEVSEENK